MGLIKRNQPNLPERRRIDRQDGSEIEGATTFRRGRTLTGSASSHVHALSESQADLKSGRVQTHILLKKRRNLMGIFWLLLLATVGLYVLVSQFTARPVVQASPDPSLQLSSLYAETIEEYLSDHMSERWRMFTDTDSLTSHLQAKAPEVASVTLGGSVGFGESLYEITFREPIASWDINSRELYVDSQGVPFSMNYFASPELRIVDRSGVSTGISGQSVMSNRFMSYIGQVIGLSKEQGFVVESIVIPEGMTRQVQVQLKDVKYPIKFSSDRLAGEGVEDMVKAIQWMSTRQISPEYVDVRVEGRVFYR